MSFSIIYKFVHVKQFKMVNGMIYLLWLIK